MKQLSLIIFGLCLSSLLIGQDLFPAVNVKSLEGKVVNTTKIVGGSQLLIISFWATWCKPCHAELNAFAELADDWKKETGVHIVAISIDDSRASSKVKTLVSGNDWPFDVYIDENNDLKRALNISSVPFLVIVKDGKIVYRSVGYSPGNENKLFAELKKISTK
jgi:thiol-disulfide isomerase/thioredoxin